MIVHVATPTGHFLRPCTVECQLEDSMVQITVADKPENALNDYRVRTPGAGNMVVHSADVFDSEEQARDSLPIAWFQGVTER